MDQNDAHRAGRRPVMPTFNEAIGLPPADPEPVIGPLNASDVGNAERLVRRHGARLRWQATAGRWLRWDGVAWRDDEAAVRRCAQLLSSDILTEAAGLEEEEDEEAAKAMRKWASASESSNRITATLKEATAIPGVSVVEEELDAHPYLLTLEHAPGIGLEVDLGRHPRRHAVLGRARPADRQHLASRALAVRWEPEARCPAWEEFLRWAMRGDEEMVGWLQRAVGYSMTGDVSEHVFFFCYGASGRNGKSTFLDVLAALSGPFGMTMPGTLLWKARDAAHPADLASLKGCRVATGNETGPTARFDEEKLKLITGGDLIPARRMGENWMRFRPTHKIWLAGQDRPLATGGDEGLWRRMRLIPFDATVPAGEEDRGLKGRLLGELPGILQWAIRGVEAWHAQGLAPPAVVRDAVAEYREASDIVAQWLAECCERDATGSSRMTDLYESYSRFRLTQGYGVSSSGALGRELSKKGFARTRPRGETGEHRPTVIVGLVLRRDLGRQPSPGGWAH
jgi:putative DNA primase/helicase